MYYEKRKKMAFIILTILITITCLTVISFCMLQPTDEHWGNVMDLSISLFIILPIIIVEIDMFLNVLYFLKDKKEKNIFKTIFSILSSIVSLLILAFMLICLFNYNKDFTIILVSLFGICILMRILYIAINSCNRHK